MSDEKKYPPIPPGSYTKDNLPPISPKAQKMLDRIWAREESPKEKADRTRAEAAIKRGDMATAIGIMFGASGYEDK